MCPFRTREQAPARREQKPHDQSAGADVLQRPVVPGGGDRRSHRRGAHPGVAGYAGLEDAAEREQEAAGPAAADAVPPALQPSRTPLQNGAGGKAGLGAHGARDRPRELLSDLRQDETGRPQPRPDPVACALGHVQWAREAGVRMTGSPGTRLLGPFEFCWTGALYLKRNKLAS